MAKHSKGRLFSTHSRGAANARFRRICITLAAVIIALIVLIIAGYSQLLAYLQGNDFRTHLSNGLRSRLGAESVEMHSNLTINGSRFSTEGISVQDAKQISDAQVNRISAEINRAALLGRRLHVRKLNMEEVSLSLVTSSTKKQSPPGAGKKENARQATGATTSSTEQKPASSTFSLKDFQLDIIECKDADLNLNHNGKQFQLLGANITAQPAAKIGSGAWQLTAENARLHTPFSFLRDSSVKTATLVYHKSGIDATECRILLTPGEMRLKAHYDLKKHRWSTDLHVNKGNLHRVLNEDWKKRFSGDLYGRMVITGKGSEIINSSGAFHIQNGILEGLPFLSQIPIGNTYPYRSIELEKAECQVLFPYDSEKIKRAWLFDKIDMRSRDASFIVKGQVIVGSDRRLGGSLTIGVPKTIISALPLSSEELTEKLFTAIGDDDAYLWVNMNLGGTLDAPREDLSIRIATLTGNKLGAMLQEIPKGTAASLFNLLLQQKTSEPQKTEQEESPEEDEAPTETPTPSRSGLLNDAADAAGSFLQSLF